MAASLTITKAITVSPGNEVTLFGDDLMPGVCAMVQFLGQGFDNTSVVNVSGPVFADDGSSVTFTVPDGVHNGALLITSNDSTTVSLPVYVVSQYVQAYEYLGEGGDVSTLNPQTGAGQNGNLVSSGGELDVILRRASQYADVWMDIEDGLRRLQVAEQHAWRSFRDDSSRRIYPFRRPVVSIDSFIVQISNMQFATFPGSDIIANIDQDYIEILSYAVASYTLLGAIQNLGLVANIVKLVYTAGYLVGEYPAPLKQAISMIATELLNYRNLNFQGFGGFSTVKEGLQQWDRRSEPFAIPQPAKEMLRPYLFRRMA